MQPNKPYQKGEIVTILTVGTVIVLSAITLVSSILLPKNKQTTASKAEDPTICSTPNKPIDYCIREECDTAISKWVMIEKFCNNEKKIIEKAGSATNRSCSQAGKQCCGGGTTSCNLSTTSNSTQTTNTTNTANQTNSQGKSNGCFSMKAEFEQKLENNKVAFYSWVTFEGNIVGDFQLEGQGVGPVNHLAGWNGPGSRWVYDPNWTQSWAPGSWIAVATLDKSKSMNLSYTGYYKNCNPQSQTVNCTLTANANGMGTVSGDGCSCKNCAATVVPTATTAPAGPAATTAPGGVAPLATPAPTKTPCSDAQGDCMSYRDLGSECSGLNKQKSGVNQMGCGGETPYCCYSTTSQPTISPKPTSDPNPTITQSNCPTDTCCFENSTLYKTKYEVHLKKGESECALLSSGLFAMLNCTNDLGMTGDIRQLKKCTTDANIEYYQYNSLDQKKYKYQDCRRPDEISCPSGEGTAALTPIAAAMQEESKCITTQCQSPNEAISFIKKSKAKGVGIISNEYFKDEADCEAGQNTINDSKSWCDEQVRGINFYVSLKFNALNIDLSREKYLELLVRRPLSNINFYYFSLNLWEGESKQLYKWSQIADTELQNRLIKRSVGVTLDYKSNNYYEKPIFARFCYYQLNDRIMTCIPSDPIKFPSGNRPEANIAIKL